MGPDRPPDAADANADGARSRPGCDRDGGDGRPGVGGLERGDGRSGDGGRRLVAPGALYGAGDVRVETVPDACLVDSTDALVEVTRAAICGSDLWPYTQMAPSDAGRRMGHEFIGIVMAVGADVRTIKTGDLVVSPFLYSDGTCVFCREGLPSSCLHGGRYGVTLDGARAKPCAFRGTTAQSSSCRSYQDDALMSSLLTLSDVMGPATTPRRPGSVLARRPRSSATARSAGRGVIAAKRLGAEQVILLGRHPDRLALGQAFGATDIVTERGEAAVARVQALTGGFGAHAVLECVGHEVSTITALDIARPGGAVGRVGVPQSPSIPEAIPTLFKNITISGGVAPARAYLDELLPDVLAGRIEPGRVFDRVVDLDGVPDGYRAMYDRDAIKVLIEV